METPNITPYLRRANYYETDQMGLIHHSNYIRWFEEARMDYMRQAGMDYADMERSGIIIPVVSISCRFQLPIHFDESIAIHTALTAFNGVRAAYRYEIITGGGTTAATGESSHCFLDVTTRIPLNLKKRHPEFYQRGTALLQAQAFQPWGEVNRI